MSQLSTSDKMKAMTNEPIISVSGLRGIVGESLDPLLAIRFVNAFVSQLEPGPIIVTRDGRATGSMLASAICSGLSAVGREVRYGDVAATPTTGVLVRQHEAAGGIQISASHNPPPYNGIKLFGSHGRVITADEGEAVIARYRADQTDWVAHDQIGSIQDLDETTDVHLDLVLKTVDVPRIQSANFKVVLDSNHGAGSVLGERLLTALGVDFKIMGDQPDGAFAHPPEPTAENLSTVVEQAKKFGADVVFCQDPDADRLALIDADGNYVGEEYTLAITLQHRLKNALGPVVINCATSQMNEDIARAANCHLERSKVGEANVTEKMLQLNAVYGGEGNGGPIDPRVGLVRDSFVGMAQTLDAMAATGKSIAELVNDIPKYSICKMKAEVDPQRLLKLFDEIRDEFHGTQYSLDDGLRLIWDDAWLLVRASNTEPIIRIIAESTTMERAETLCEKVVSVV